MARPVVQTQLDGVVDLPPGKIAAVATYLEIRRPQARPARPDLGQLRLAPLRRDLARYRALYGRVGRPWLWFSRARMSDAALAAIIDHPAVDALALVADGQDVGILELDFRIEPVCELAFLGVVPDWVGRKAGRLLIREGIARAFARPIERLWLHTCTLDHPAALGAYRAEGFVPYRRAVEVADDPRLVGTLPREAAPHLPLL